MWNRGPQQVLVEHGSLWLCLCGHHIRYFAVGPLHCTGKVVVLCGAKPCRVIACSHVRQVHAVLPWLGTGLLGTSIIIVHTAFIYLAMMSHFRAMMSNPGAVPAGAQPLETVDEFDRIRFCYRCERYKPSRAHHCSICNRCVIKMDHHCPWINNCVGLANHKFFILFVSYVCLASVVSVIAIGGRLISCIGTGNSDCLGGGLGKRLNMAGHCRSTLTWLPPVLMRQRLPACFPPSFSRSCLACSHCACFVNN